MANFTIPGQPLPKERPQFGKGRTFTRKATRDEETRVASFFTAQYEDGHMIDKPLTGALKVVANFYRKNGVEADVDNLWKLVGDALNGVAWADDRQIKKLRVNYFVDRDSPRTEMEIWAIGEVA